MHRWFPSLCALLVATHFQLSRHVSFLPLSFLSSGIPCPIRLDLSSAESQNKNTHKKNIVSKKILDTLLPHFLTHILLLSELPNALVLLNGHRG